MLIVEFNDTLRTTLIDTFMQWHCRTQSPDAPAEALPIDVDQVNTRYANDRELVGMVIQGFFDNCEQDMAQLNAALDDEQREQVRELAHRIKGMAGQAGANDLAEAAKSLEHQALESDARDLMSAADALRAEIDRCFTPRDAIERSFNLSSDG